MGSVYLFTRHDNGVPVPPTKDDKDRDANVRVANVVPVAPDRQPVESLAMCDVASPPQTVLVAGCGGGSGVVVVFDVKAGRVVAQHARHKGSDVIAVAVDPDSGRVVSADAAGTLVIADFGFTVGPEGGPATVGLKAAGSLFKMVSAVASAASAAAGAGGGAGGGLNAAKEPATAVVKLEAPIVQVQLAPASPADKNMTLLVSTTTRAVLLTVPAAARGAALAAAKPEIQQIGKKPRDGVFGACFDPVTAVAAVGAAASGAAAPGRLLLAARPAKRMWIGDAESASVLSTLKFEVDRGAIPFAGAPASSATAPLSAAPPPKVKHAFGRLLPFMSLFPLNITWSPAAGGGISLAPLPQRLTPLFISWVPGSPALYVVDMHPLRVAGPSGGVMEWHADFGTVFDVTTAPLLSGPGIYPTSLPSSLRHPPPAPPSSFLSPAWTERMAASVM